MDLILLKARKINVDHIPAIHFFNIGLHDSGGVLSVQRIAFSKEFIVKGIHHFIK